MHSSLVYSSLAILVTVGGCAQPGERMGSSAEPQSPVPLASATNSPTRPLAQTSAVDQTSPLDPDLEIPTVEQVKSVLYRPGCGNNRVVGELTNNELTITNWGVRAFPAYESILADPASDVLDFEGACIAIHQVKADRRRFIPNLVHRLIAPDALVRVGVTRAWESEVDEGNVAYHRNSVRRTAIELLGEIGGGAETVFISPYLYHNDFGVQYAVLAALSKIGGKRDLDTVNTWLCNPWPQRPEEFLRKVRKCRDRIEARVVSAMHSVGGL